MKLFLLSILLAFSVSMFAHSLHMSVTNINISDAKVEVVVRAFSKDVANELNAVYHLDKSAEDYLLKAPDDSLLLKHFKKHIAIQINSDILVLEDLKVKLIDDEFVFSFEDVMEAECLNCTLSNTILFQTYHDQKNLVIINNRGIEKGIELNVDNPKEFIEFIKK